MKYILAIDQGTTSTKAILFDEKMHISSLSQKEFPQLFPSSGWVEHNPEDIWNSVISCCLDAVNKSNASFNDIAAIGITNQRETTIVWDKNTGVPIYNAIVWQDRRTSDFCEKLKKDGYAEEITHKTGLLLDPYFSATKLKWVLDNVPNARQKARDGTLLFGTVDCYLIWKLTKGKVHATDATNASRTMMYNIRTSCWDSEICSFLDIPMIMLPTVKDCAAHYGDTAPDVFEAQLPILGVAGDQQAATIGQACFDEGMIKSTYGTGCFALYNTGKNIITSKNRLLTTIAYQFDGIPTYALEGSIFMAGAVIQWLRDGLKIIEDASDTDDLAKLADTDHKLYMVPAFTGLGAPYWDSQCRGAIFALTRNSGPADFARAALECVAYQTRDLLDAMQKDIGHNTDINLRIDGGMASSDWTVQFLADMLNAKVDRPVITETTALGAAWLAGMCAGLYPDRAQFSKNWQLERRFEPNMDAKTRDKLYSGWKDAVRRTLSTNE